MKVTSISTLLTATAILLLSNCKKQDSDKLFDGDSRIRGIVLYDNIADGKRDTAATVDFKLYRQSAPNAVYQVSVTNGRFDLKGLANDQFTLEGSMTIAGNVTYTGTQKLDLSKGGFLDLQQLVLKPASIQRPTLVLKVNDYNGGAVKGAQVGLYTDPNVITLNPYSTTGSVYSGITNANGIIVFSGLQTINYYADVYIAAGNDTLSNFGHTADIIGPLSSTIPTPQTITVGINNPSLTVTVTDVNNAFIGNATVRLYSDKNLLAKYGNDGTGTGSLRSANTDIQGNVRFNHLQTINYYISVRKLIGKDTLSNKLNETNPTSVQSGNNVLRVVIK